MKFLSNRYAKVFTHKGFDIYTLKSACPAKGDRLGYVIDDERFANQDFNLLSEAIEAINESLKGEMMKNIKVGDKVKWDSYKSYRIIERTGTVIAVVRKGESANKYIPPTAKKTHIKFDLDVNSIDRVLVAVATGADGQITHYYGRPSGTVKLIEN